MKMLQSFVCWFMIYVSLVTEGRCESSKDEWEIFTIDTLNLTLDFEDGAKLASILDPSCNSTELTFEFELDWDELVANALNNQLSSDQTHSDSSTSTTSNSTKIVNIVVCAAVAVVVAALLYVYGKGILMTYLQSGSYRVVGTNTAGNSFHEMPEVKFRKD